MPRPLLGSGEPEDVDGETVVDPFAERVGELADRLAVLEDKMATVKRDAVVALLTMLSESMRHIASGKMEIPETVSPQGSNSKWDGIKSRLTPRLSEAIDIILLQGPMKRTQLAAALRMDYSNCTKNVITILIRQGLFVESGGNISLKQL